jgi:hypothetical protein
LKGVVFASSAVYVSFTFEVHTSISSYSLSYSQFVGAAKREGENISVIYIRSKVTGLLFFQVGLKTYCPPGRPNSCPACVNSISTYCEYGNETSFYFPPYDEPQRMLCPFDPRPQDLISIAGFLKEYTKNELLKYQQIQILNFLQ